MAHTNLVFRRRVKYRRRNAMSGLSNGVFYRDDEPWKFSATHKPPYLKRATNRKRNKAARASRKRNR